MNLLGHLVLLAQILYVVHVHLVKYFWVLSVLWLEVEVDFQALHLGFQLPLLLLLLFFHLLLLLLLLLIHLHGFELVKNILVVQDRVREFIFEVIFVQEICDPIFNEINFENLVDRRTAAGVSFQHQAKEVRNVLAKVGRRVCVSSLNNLLSQLVKRLSVERRHEGAHLVEQHSEGPNVTFEGVRLALDDLRRKIVGRSNHRLRL